MRILTVVGARPQFVKAAAVHRVIARHPALTEIIVHTGQHFDREMSKVFFEELAIPEPRYHLGVHSLSHGAMTGRMIERIEEVLLRERPDWVLVYGDTNSTLAGALAARKLGIRIAHIEAGLRSFRMAMPEEVNRVLTDRISDLLCCPTTGAVANLVREGFRHYPATIVRTGDVMYDAALHYGSIADRKSDIRERLGLERYLLGTVHRAENTDHPGRLEGIVAALNALSREVEVVVPLHPRTRRILRSRGIRIAFRTLPPLGYLDLVRILKGARMVLTDSGGLQKEAFFFKKPVVTLREETEWTELVAAGCNILAGASTKRILDACRRMSARGPSFASRPYGRGRAAEKVVWALLNCDGDGNGRGRKVARGRESRAARSRRGSQANAAGVRERG